MGGACCDHCWIPRHTLLVFVSLPVVSMLRGRDHVLTSSCRCITARRRRRRGLQPYRGTGWLGGNHGPVTYNPQPYYNNNQYPNQPGNNTTYGNNGGGAPPTYNASNAGYYGQNSGVEMQPPQNSYQPNTRDGDNVYAPPSSPPPGKGHYGNDGIIR
jgi:hypothetical protein